LGKGVGAGRREESSTLKARGQLTGRGQHGRRGGRDGS